MKRQKQPALAGTIPSAKQRSQNETDKPNFEKRVHRQFIQHFAEHFGELTAAKVPPKTLTKKAELSRKNKFDTF